MMFFKNTAKKKIAELKEEMALVEGRLSLLLKKSEELEAACAELKCQVEELGKRTISQKTLAEGEPVSAAQVLREFLFGEED